MIPLYTRHTFLIVSLSTLLLGCIRKEDPGPLRYGEKEYQLSGFNSIEAGDALLVSVNKGTRFSVRTTGDKRNLEDLAVYIYGNTLIARFTTNRTRKHQTNIEITMPSILKGSFSGASNTQVIGFKEKTLSLALTGASRAVISGSAETFTALLSGASVLEGFNLGTTETQIDASGASKANIAVNHSLKGSASGASLVNYMGNPTIDVKTSGASSVNKY